MLLGRAEVMTDCHVLDPGTYVVFSIGGRGSGIPDEIFDRVLEPLFTTRAAGAGSGLGLSMVAGIARNSGGGLKTKSFAAGTRVVVYLQSASNLEDRSQIDPDVQIDNTSACDAGPRGV